MDFTQLYTATVTMLGHELQPADGLSEGDIERRESALGVRLPDALRLYLRIAGRLDKLNRSHNQLCTLEELEIRDGYLIFMVENQAVVSWGVRAADLSQRDPEVWQALNEEPVEWFSEGMPLSYFLVFSLAYQGFESEG